MKLPFQLAGLRLPSLARPSLQGRGGLVRGVRVVSAEGQRSDFRLSYRLDGSPRAKPGALPDHGPFLLLLDPRLPYRRRLQTLPRQRRAQGALLRAAPSQFPFAAEQTRYVLGQMDGQPYIFALPPALLDPSLLTPPPRAILIAEGKPDADAVATAIRDWWSYGRMADLSAAPRAPLPLPAVVLGLLLALTMAALAGLAVWLPKTLHGDERIQAEIRQLKPAAEPILRQHTAVLRMHHTLLALATLPGGPVHEHLSTLLHSVPEGVDIQHLGYHDGRLKLAGIGGEKARQWLLGQGIPDDLVALLPDPAGKRYRVEFSVSQYPPPQQEAAK